MFKKAKLYSFLALIVASTIVGLISLSKVALAQSSITEESLEACVSAGLSAEITDTGNIIYDGKSYERWPDTEAFPDAPTNTAWADTSSGSPVRVIFVNDGANITNPPGGESPIGLVGFYKEYNLADDGTYAPRDLPSYVKDTNDDDDCGYATKQQLDLAIDRRSTVDAGEIPEVGGVDGAPDNDGDGAGSGTSSEPKSCQIKGVGWLICPVVNFLAEVTDKSYDVLNNTLLKLEPIALPGGSQSDSNDSKMQLYNSWRSMRDFANIIFIIAFLLIVFSQITNVGISNYGLKRLLPKIVIAAILVNLSYYICAIAVDVSNILGNELRGLLMPKGGASLQFHFTADTGDGVKGFESTGFSGIAGIILGAALTGVIIYTFLPVFLPLVVTAAVAVITVVVVLTLRQALVVILIVVSPLAFVSLLLPNTESYFKKWRTLFIAMLMLYPIISVMFGASALASNILMTSTDDFWVQMVGAGVSIIPLLITPFVIRATGGILNRWAGVINDPNKGFFDNKRKSLTERGQMLRAGRAQRVGRFVDQPNRVSGALGGAGSRSRRWLTMGTGYAANNRERSRKDALSTAESGMESTYLGSAGGQQARSAAKNAQINLQNAQIDTETVRLSSSEGRDLQRETKQSEVQKHIAETRAQTAAISAIPHALESQAKLAETQLKQAEDESAAAAYTGLTSDLAGRAALGAAEDAKNSRQIAENDAKATGIARADRDLKLQTETSSEALTTLQNKDKQLLEEVAAQGADTISRSAGISDTTAAAAQASRFESKAVDSAVSTAKTAGEEAYADEVLTPGSTYAVQAGGNIDNERGQGRARARAVSVQSSAANEAVNNAKTLLEHGDPTQLTDRAKVALIDANNSGDVITARAAAQILKGAGAKGGKMLSDTIESIETAGVQNGDVFANLRADLVGEKASNSALDKWATEGGTLVSKIRDPGTIERLNEQELASQQMHVLQDAEAAGTLAANVDLIKRLLEQNDNGTIKLDTKKRELLSAVAFPPAIGPPIPPPTRTRTTTTADLPIYGPPTP